MSFDISVIDIAMLVAIVVLFALYATSTPKAGSTGKPVLRRVTNTKRITNSADKQDMNPKLRSKQPNCAHFLGYLKTRKEKNVPEECVGCATVVRCLLLED